MARDGAETGDRARDYGFDDWPIEGYDDHDERSVNYLGTTTPAEEGSGADVTAVVYDEGSNTIFEAAPDRDRQRLVPREGTEREVDSGDALGEALEDLGDRLDWDSLSEFARERLQDDPDRERRETRTVSPESVTFTQSNVAESDDHDLEFTGSGTYRTEDGQVYVVERVFEGSLDDPDDPDRAVVDVTEQLLRAEEPRAERRDGDAERIDEKERTLTVELDDVDADRRVETVVGDRCETYHESKIELPA